MARRRPLEDRCDECGHPWQEHPGAHFDASIDEVCGECAYEDEHEGRTSLCRRHAPADLVRDIRNAFIVDVAPGTAGWDALLTFVRTYAAEIALDIPETADWPPVAAKAAATLRRRAALKDPGSSGYTSMPRLGVDDEVWAAFVTLADRSYSATALRSPEGWDPLLDLNDEGTSVVASLTPDEWAILIAELGRGVVRPISRRRRRRFWDRRQS